MSSCKFTLSLMFSLQLTLFVAKSNQITSDLWIQHQRKNTKTTRTWACIFCPEWRIFATEPALWEHGKTDHDEQLSARNGDPQGIREHYAAESAQNKYTHYFHIPLFYSFSKLVTYIYTQTNEGQLTATNNKLERSKQSAARGSDGSR
jgi:hypothetical protein